jgi:cation transport protein ChaC
MAEYLHSTVARLEALGIHDRHLWLLQEMVAQRIERAHDLSVASVLPAAGER